MEHKRHRWFWIVLALVMEMVLVSIPDSSSAQNNGTDKAVAHIDITTFGPNQWDVSARSNFNGTQPTGSWRFTNSNADPNIVVSGEVTCLQVAGNVALVGGIVTEVRGTTTTANGFVAEMTDSGKFATAPDTFGAFLFVSSPTLVAGACPPTGFVFTQTVVDGEVIVVDALH